MTAALALDARGLSKSFGASRVLDDVDFEVRAGEVHALLGQNGSGKSTLVKAITGVHLPDSGSVESFGRVLPLPVRHLSDHGVAVIHQDLGLVESMTVIENLGVNASYGARLLGAVRTRSERALYQGLMDRLDISLPLDALVADLSQAERAMLAVVRAFRVLSDDEGTRNGRHLFILDEPTAPLSGGDAQAVLELMRRMADAGAGVVFISHRINEVLAISDRITVLRAGRRVLTSDVAGLSRADIVSAMLGERMEEFFPNPGQLTGSEPRLVVTGLTGGGASDVSLTVAPGEILGLTGLAGMGQSDVLPTIFGATALTAGAVELDGTSVGAASPREAMAHGIAFVPGDRLGEGCWPEGTARENLTLAVLRDFTGRFGIGHRAETARAAALHSTSGAVPNNPELPMTSFSGGNQQKLLFEKWRQLRPGLLLIDEPTQGVDPKAAKTILDRIVDEAASGASVVICSGDYEQLAEVCHRVLVFSHGRVIDELSGEGLTEAGIILACENSGAN